MIEPVPLQPRAEIECLPEPARTVRQRGPAPAS
jgi:hypothetical protein